MAMFVKRQKRLRRTQSNNNNTGANVSQENSSTNRTAWPLDGGSVVLSSSHEWVITYVNLGLGDEVTGFNVSLLAAYNVTGNGTVRLDGIGADVLPSLNLTDGQPASLQFVHIGDRGNALYNVRSTPTPVFDAKS
jgi:hypothetical protein